jgi:hypothetical protein
MEYTLMHKNFEVADIRISETTKGVERILNTYAKERLPVGVVKANGQTDTAYLNEWRAMRAIPSSRMGLRPALDALGVKAADLPFKGFGLSLSDQYWLRPRGQDIDWRDINYFDNGFSPDVGDALFGRSPKTKPPALKSPDNTSDGWLKKRWIIAEGKRMLVKSGSPPYYQEPINEALSSIILEKMNIPHAHYDLIWDKDEPFSVCENFVTPDTELVTAWHIFNTGKKSNSDSDYAHFLKRCASLGIPNMEKSLRDTLIFDYIIANTDRHFNNFGAVRNAETLEWISPAPVFDSGTSLWHNLHGKSVNHFVESKPFKNTHAKQIKLVKDFEGLNFSALAGIEDVFESLLKKNVFIDKERRDILCAALKTRVDQARNIALLSSREKITSSPFSETRR